MNKKTLISIKKSQKANNFIIESVKTKDYPALRKLALKHALLNLPNNPKLLKKKIAQSISSFNGKTVKSERNFLFVMKKAPSGVIVGSAQISSKMGTKKKPFYSLNIQTEHGGQFLKLKTLKNGPSYLGGLIVDKALRGNPQKLGKQLSQIRFLFAGLCPQHFEDTLHAEVAPFLDLKGKNPFFELFVKKYISLSMQQIDYLTLTNKEKLFTHYPRGKIWLKSLPPKALKTLGKSGRFSQRAEKLLKKQNFTFAGAIDPFDGGPYLQAKRQNIPIIKNSRKVVLKAWDKKVALKKSPNKKIFKPSTTNKWLFGFLKRGGFKGGVLEGCLQGQTLLVHSKALKDFGLHNNPEVLVTRFK